MTSVGRTCPVCDLAFLTVTALEAHHRHVHEEVEALPVDENLARARAMLARLSGRDWLAELEQTGENLCDDCVRLAQRTYRYGRRVLCLDCAAARRRVADRLTEVA